MLGIINVLTQKHRYYKMINIYFNNSLVAYVSSANNQLEFIATLSTYDTLNIKAKYKRALAVFTNNLGDSYQFTDEFSQETINIVK